MRGKSHICRPPVKVAVVPAAGRGTRWLPLSKAVPKELLPIGGRPMIQWTAEEAMSAGIETLCVILHPEKMLIREFFFGAERGEEPALESLREIRRRMELVFLIQREPLGVADAVGQARSLVGESPFALMLPDNVFAGAAPAIAQLFPYREAERDLTALYRLTRRNASWFGNCGRTRLRQERGRLYRILRLQRKRPGYQRLPRAAVWVALARSILGPHFFDYLERLRRDLPAGELDDVPIFQVILAERGLFGVKLCGQAFDVGNPRGYAAANWLLRD